MIFPFSSTHLIKLYWGTDEILLPVYQSTREALTKHPEVSVVVNFASFRSVYPSVLEVLENHSNQIRTIAVIAEGVPESQTRSIIKKAQACNVGIIGPATVGGIKPGCFRIGTASCTTRSVSLAMKSTHIHSPLRRSLIINHPLTLYHSGNTGGMLDNIVMAKLYRPGSVAYVSRSGGLSNELNNLISRHRYVNRQGVGEKAIRLSLTRS